MLLRPRSGDALRRLRDGDFRPGDLLLLRRLGDLLLLREEVRLRSTPSGERLLEPLRLEGLLRELRRDGLRADGLLRRLLMVERVDVGSGGGGVGGC